MGVQYIDSRHEYLVLETNLSDSMRPGFGILPDSKSFFNISSMYTKYQGSECICLLPSLWTFGVSLAPMPSSRHSLSYRGFRRTNLEEGRDKFRGCRVWISRSNWYCSAYQRCATKVNHILVELASVSAQTPIGFHAICHAFAKVPRNPNPPHLDPLEQAFESAKDLSRQLSRVTAALQW